MRIDFKNNNTHFNAGMTPNIKLEIAQVNPVKIEKELRTKNIFANLTDNKFIAWSVRKCYEIIDEINQKCGTSFGLPQFIVVEDFELLKTKKDLYCFCNFAPTRLYKNSDVLIPEKTIFINSFGKENINGKNKIWDNIDKMMDVYKHEGLSATDSFIEIFLHEFFHVVHSYNMIKNLGGQKYVDFIEKIMAPEYIERFQKKYGQIFSSICSYAATAPVETIACDLSKRSISCMDESFRINKNFIKGSPYEEIGFIERIFKNRDLIDSLLCKIWDGKMV